MELSIRDVEPADAEGLVRVLNPIIESRRYTALDTPVDVETERDYVIDFSERGVWKVAVRQPDQAIVGTLLDNVRGPPRDARNDEQWREHRGRYAAEMIGRGAVEIEIGK